MSLIELDKLAVRGTATHPHETTLRSSSPFAPLIDRMDILSVSALRREGMPPSEIDGKAIGGSISAPARNGLEVVEYHTTPRAIEGSRDSFDTFQFRLTEDDTRSGSVTVMRHTEPGGFEIYEVYDHRRPSEGQTQSTESFVRDIVDQLTTAPTEHLDVSLDLRVPVAVGSHS